MKFFNPEIGYTITQPKPSIHSVSKQNIHTQITKPIMSSKTSQQQQANFKTNSDPAQGISICIPRVFNNIGWRRIKQHMIEANLGYVERVDVIPLGGFKRAFVHFRANGWNTRDPTARAALQALQEGKKIKLEYEAPWYWLVSISGAKRPAEAPKPRERKTTIDLNPTVTTKQADDQPFAAEAKAAEAIAAQLATDGDATPVEKND